MFLSQGILNIRSHMEGFATQRPQDGMFLNLEKQFSLTQSMSRSLYIEMTCAY